MTRSVRFLVRPVSLLAPILIALAVAACTAPPGGSYDSGGDSGGDGGGRMY